MNGVTHHSFFFPRTLLKACGGKKRPIPPRFPPSLFLPISSSSFLSARDITTRNGERRFSRMHVRIDSSATPHPFHPFKPLEECDTSYEGGRGEELRGGGERRYTQTAVRPKVRWIGINEKQRNYNNNYNYNTNSNNRHQTKALELYNCCKKMETTRKKRKRKKKHQTQFQCSVFASFFLFFFFHLWHFSVMLYFFFSFSSVAYSEWVVPQAAFCNAA